MHILTAPGVPPIVPFEELSQIYLSELCSLLARLSQVEACDILQLGDVLFEKVHQFSADASIEPSIRFIPRVSDFVTERILGAGSFGVVYKAIYLPGSYFIHLSDLRRLQTGACIAILSYPISANMVCTLKIVSAALFSIVDHIIADRVTAAIIDHPMLVVYHCVFSTETATITMMEYLKGVDVQKGFWTRTYSTHWIVSSSVLALRGRRGGRSRRSLI